MDIEELMDRKNRLFREANKKSREKTRAYAGTDDVFKNMESVKQFDVASTETGCMVRLLDKVGRLASYHNNAFEPSDESFEDTIVDAINYLCYYYIMVNT